MKKQTKKPVKTTKAHNSPKKHSQKFLKVYWPYVPLFILVFFGVTFGYNWQPSRPNSTLFNKQSVLAYASEISSSGLLASTNSYRSQNGAIALTLNSKLASAAQSKANDMMARNYWSHNTPDGKEPWTFVEAAGYTYLKAGENLAYGFDSSNDTVVGWMNSASHRANMLDTAFKEVGFGFVNAPSYVGNGEETIVVAMYGNPYTSTPAATQPATTTQQSQAPASTPKTTPAAAPSTPTPTQPTNQDTTVPTTQNTTTELKPLPAERINQPVNTDNPIPASQPATRITKLQSITNGQAPWSAALLSGTLVFVVGAWVSRHLYVVKKVLIDGEQFMLHHPLIDVGVLTLVGIAILLSQSSGIVK